MFHNRPGGASIDQIIADGLFNCGLVTPLHSLVVHYGGENASSPVFRPDGTPVPQLWAPNQVYDAVFPSALRSDAASRSRLGDRWAAAEALSEQLSSHRRGQLSGDQARRMDLHREIRGGHQERLRAQLGGLDVAVPSREEIRRAWPENWSRSGPPSPMSLLEAWRHTSTDNLDMVATALQLDLTRVAVVSGGWLPGEDWTVDGERFRRGTDGNAGTFGYLDAHEFHHALAGDLPGSNTVVQEALRASPGLSGAERDAIRAKAERFMTAYHNQVTSPFGYLLDRLRTAIDSNGRSVLDNTIVLLASEMANPGHSGEKLHWSLIVGDSIAEREGLTLDRTLMLKRSPRAVESASGVPIDPSALLPPSEWRHLENYAHAGVGNGQLFVTLSRMMGVPIDHVGPSWLTPSPLDLQEPDATIVPPVRGPGSR